MVYGLTKGQAPTSRRGFVTPVQVGGVILEPFNPLASAIALDASFVARAFIGNQEQTKEILKKAIQHNGYALVDIFQPCVSFNKSIRLRGSRTIRIRWGMITIRRIDRRPFAGRARRAREASCRWASFIQPEQETLPRDARYL
jgi:pyruvate/2-oxoacid:ferredoxin oxidoreductase beta subunit